MFVKVLSSWAAALSLLFRRLCRANERDSERSGVNQRVGWEYVCFGLAPAFADAQAYAVVYWDAIPKPVELLTPYDAQGQTLFSNTQVSSMPPLISCHSRFTPNTQVPECVMSSVDGARLLPLLPAVANFSTLRLYRDSDDPAFSNGPGYYATYTPATYLPASGSAQPLLLSSATFNPPDFAATTLPVVAAPLSPSCLLNASQAWSDCAPCWAAPGSPFANAAALAGSVAFVDLNNLPSTIVAYCLKRVAIANASRIIHLVHC